VASKSRNRGGATRARSAARRAGIARAGNTQSGAAQDRSPRARAAQAGTAQLTASAATDADPAVPQGRERPETGAYPGQKFGLPEQGPRSVASINRRVLALFVDWLLSLVIAYWLTHSTYWTIAVFAVEVYALTALTGTTVGKRLCGIRVIRTGGGLVGFRWALVRTALLLTVVLPLLTDFDRRGVHDRAADTIVVRL
jgi:RDD family